MKSFIKIRRAKASPSSLYRLETGFSMLEAVVVVGVLLALAVGGFFAFGPITENAKQSKVKSAASEIHTGVLAASMDGDSETTPQKVIDGWNGRTDKIRVAITSASGMTSSDDYCVTATDVNEPSITSQAGNCSGATGGSGAPIGGDPVDGGDVTPVADTSSIMTTVFDTSLTYDDDSNPETAPATCTTITIPITENVNATIDWGDGTPVQTVVADSSTYTDLPSHTYVDTPGVHTITIDGTFTSWVGYNWDTWSTRCITKVTSWGDGTGTVVAQGGFYDTTNLVEVARIPSSLTDASYLFPVSTFEGGGVENWDTSNIKTLSNFINANYSFAGDISGWDVSNVEDMSGAFSDSNFNGDISDWDVTGATDMAAMFTGSAFNGDISNWDVSNVTDMAYMFADSKFNSNISNWNVSNVTQMEMMFMNTTEFNQDIGNWNVSKVGQPYPADHSHYPNQPGSMQQMFKGAAKFDQDLTRWNTMAGLRHTEFNVDSALPDSKMPIWK